MSTGLRILLVLVCVYGAYREICVARYQWARLRARFGPFRGVRIVYRRGGHVQRLAASPELRLVHRQPTNHHASLRKATHG